MPTYVYKHPDKEEYVEVVQSMNEDHVYFDENKLEWKRVFINPTITFLNEDKCSFNEGCLSIPDIREDIERFDYIKIDFYDENFNLNSMEFNGILSRVILHEYDHIDGVLFTDKISKFKKTLIQKKLNKISRGQVDVNYPMKFCKK